MRGSRKLLRDLVTIFEAESDHAHDAPPWEVVHPYTSIASFRLAFGPLAIGFALSRRRRRGAQARYSFLLDKRSGVVSTSAVTVETGAVQTQLRLISWPTQIRSSFYPTSTGRP
jgi:hypothetical protein